MSPEKKPVIRRACAKINLTFEVLSKRPDGYHEIISVMQAVSLCDLLTFEPSDDVRLASNVAELVSPNNLVYKAAVVMCGLAGGRRGVSVSLAKAIPLAGGLGGGSSDAAAALLALNEMWGVNLPQGRLAEISAQLGSDVPFFVNGSTTALASGRGDNVETLPPPPTTWVVLLRPPVEMPNKTREMYARLDSASFTRGQHGRGLAKAIRAGETITNHGCYNAFGELALAVFPGLDHYRRQFLASGAEEVHLAGAGPTLFTLVGSREEGEEILGRLRKQRMEAYLAETL